MKTEINKIINEAHLDLDKSFRKQKRLLKLAEKGDIDFIIVKNIYGNYALYPMGDSMLNGYNMRIEKAKVFPKTELKKYNDLIKKQKRLFKQIQKFKESCFLMSNQTYEVNRK